MNIDYDYYRLFYYVAKYKNLSLVAKLLNSNQPNLSKLMNKLEQQMGCKLMIRTNRGITLTNEGEKLFRHVAIAYNELRSAEAELSAENEMSAGMICIGATQTAQQCILVSSIASFKQRYPKITISMTNYTTLQAIEALKQGIVDFALVDAPFNKKTNFQQTVLMQYSEVLVASAESPFAKAKSLKLRRLAEIPLIGLGNYSNTAEYHSKFFAEQGLDWNPDIGVSTYNQIIPLVKAGIGIAFIPEFMARPYLDDGSLVELETDGFSPRRDIVLLEDREQHSSIAARKLISDIKSEHRKF